jgi:hypothetical protein
VSGSHGGPLRSSTRREKPLAWLGADTLSQGLISSVATTFNTPYTLGGPSSTVFAWMLGSIMNLTLGAAIGEIVSAYVSGLLRVSLRRSHLRSPRLAVSTLPPVFSCRRAGVPLSPGSRAG